MEFVVSEQVNGMTQKKMKETFWVNYDLDDKIEEARDTIRARQGELNEIKKLIEAKAEKGRQL